MELIVPVIADRFGPHAGLDVATAGEQGIDVTLSNRRGIYGPLDMSTSAVEYWKSALERTYRDVARHPGVG